MGTIVHAYASREAFRWSSSRQYGGIATVPVRTFRGTDITHVRELAVCGRKDPFAERESSTGRRPACPSNRTTSSCPHPTDPWLMATGTSQGKPSSEVKLLSEVIEVQDSLEAANVVLRPEAQRRLGTRDAWRALTGDPQDHRAGAAQVGLPQLRRSPSYDHRRQRTCVKRSEHPWLDRLEITMPFQNVRIEGSRMPEISTRTSLDRMEVFVSGDHSRGERQAAQVVLAALHPQHGDPPEAVVAPTCGSPEGRAGGLREPPGERSAW